jgi:hypothetical protein
MAGLSFWRSIDTPFGPDRDDEESGGVDLL